MEMQVSVSHFKEEQTTFASGPVHAVIAEQAITEPVLFSGGCSCTRAPTASIAPLRPRPRQGS